MRPPPRFAGRVFAAIFVLLATSSPARAGDAAARAADEAESRLLAADAEPGARSEHLEAARRAIEAAKGSADDARCQALLARTRVALGRFDEAEAAAVRATALAPRGGSCWLAAGAVALARGDPDAAAARLLQAIDADDPPLSPAARAAALRDRGRALLRTGDVSGALAAARVSLEIEAASADGDSLRAWCEVRASLDAPHRHEARAAGFRVRTDISADIAQRAAARIASLVPCYAARFPVPRGIPAAREVPVYVVDEAMLARLRPPGPPARAFYQRDEQAVFACGDKPPELMRLLAHECFHAWLARRLADAPPWLDEGYADYFGGFVSDGAPGAAAKTRPGPEPIRLRDLQVAFEGGHDVRLADLCERSRQAFYEGADVYARFAGAWGYVHYFREADGGRRAGPLDAYAARLLSGGSAEEAYAVAFGGQDIVGIESAMRAHALSLRE